MHLDAVVEWDILSLILFQAEYMLENKLETWQEEEGRNGSFSFINKLNVLVRTRREMN